MATLETNHILVGLGGTGGKILRAFKMRMLEEFPNKEEREKQPVALLYVDSTREMMGRGRPDTDVMGEDASFVESEFLFIKDRDIPDILDKIDYYPELKGIVNNVGAVRTAIGNLGEAAGQKRRAGRILFAANAREYVDALKKCFLKCSERSHNNSQNIHIFTGLCGGTGSGSIIDAIVQARNIPGWESAQINVYAMLPEQDLPQADMDKGRYYENGYAALSELNALQCGQYHPCDVLSSGKPLNLFNAEIKGVANSIAVYSNVNDNGHVVDSFTELPKIVSDFVYSRIFAECEGIIRTLHFEEIIGAEIVRTKKQYSFGLKRVIYPEMRILKHMTYTVGLSVLYQFRFNNWRSSLGFINEEKETDYRAEYLKDDTLSRWMLDESHLTLEEDVMTAKSGATYDTFSKEWKSKISHLADFCGENEYPLAELSKLTNRIFDESFRDEGVSNYYNTKLGWIDAIARDIRKNIEKELFGKWRDGAISIIELSRIGELLVTYVSDNLKKKLDASVVTAKDNLKVSDDILSDITTDWTNVGFFGKFFTKKKEACYVKYQDELGHNLELRTRLIGLDFARQLASELQREIGRMSDDINWLSKMLNDAIDETNRLITAQQKANKGLEDMDGAVIEVSDEELMMKYEDDIRFDKEGMSNIARQLREAILPDSDFRSFGDLCNKINVKTIKHAFDLTLSEKILTKHADLPPSSTKVLGLNLLTQLRQKLGTNHHKIQQFAHDILKQSGAYINLDRNKIVSNTRNNDQPDENKNINLREVLISIPSPDDDPALKDFANELKNAFEEQAENDVKKPVIYMGSTRKNELSVITINYAFPMRAATWLADYKKRYEKYLHTGNANTDLSHAILLHSEGLGENLPDLLT